jgi:hypothetical protein
LFVFSSAFILLSVFDLFHPLPAHHYISEHLPSTNSINLAAKSTYPLLHLTHYFTMSSSSAPAAAKDIKSVLENKPLKFKFKTGGASYIAQVHTDRSS